MHASTINIATRFIVRDFASGNGRNRCAGVFDTQTRDAEGPACVSNFHARDHGATYMAMAKAEALRLNISENEQ